MLDIRNTIGENIHMVVSERAMVDAVVAYVLENKIRVQNPDYLATGVYTSQWRQTGAVAYYQLPRGGKVIALRTPDACWFDASGMSILSV